MADVDVLRDLVRDEALVLAEPDVYGNNVLVLAEQEPQAGYSIVIRKVPDRTVAIRPERIARPRFRGDRGECKRADFVVVASTDRGNWIVYIELKREKKSKTEVKQQLLGAKCVVAYCKAVVEQFWQERDFLDEGSYQQRFVSVTGIGVDKKPTRTRKHELHDTPDGVLRINAPRGSGLRFRELVGGDG